MPSSRNHLIKRIYCLGLGLVAALHLGCGLDRLKLPLPNEIEGMSLEELGDIQDDERLTNDEKRQAIREATGAPDSAEGDRLVEFLLNMNVS